MTCTDCTKATEGLWGKYDYHCSRCRARFVRNSLPYHEAKKEGRVTKRYADFLRMWNVSHDEVKEQV